MKAKKALGAYDMIYWIARILFAVFMLITLYTVATIYESKILDTAEIEAKLFKHYILYSPNGLSYTDPNTGRLYPGVVSLDNFNSERLESAASFGEINNMIAAKITLYGPKGGPPINEVYYNKDRYDAWFPLTYSPKVFKVVGTVHSQFSYAYVAWLDSNGYKREGSLRFEILVPRT